MNFLRIVILTTFFFCSTYAIHVNVKNETSANYCIVLDSDISGSINYYDNKKNETVAYNFVVNGSVTADGQCYEVQNKRNTEFIAIDFLPNDIKPKVAVKRWLLKLVFKAQEENIIISDYLVSAYFYPDVFNTSTVMYVYKKTVEPTFEWKAKKTYGFSCSKSELGLTNGSSLLFDNLKVLAFTKLNSSSFPANQLFEKCAFDIRTSDLVPIVVGACLAGFVIVVLIAYIIGRARAKRQGYASV